MYALTPAPENLPEEYRLVGEESYVLTVANGIPDQDDFTFTYTNERVASVVTVHYTDTTGRTLADDQQLTLEGEGEVTLTPDESLIPEGYVSGNQTAVVTIAKSGVVTPSEVTFVLPEKTYEDGDEICLYAVTSQKNVNIRATSSKNAKKVTSIKTAGTYVWVVTRETNKSKEVWYQINYNGYEGFVRSDMITLLSKMDSDAYAATLSSPVPTAVTEEPTVEPATEPTPTPTPAAVEPEETAAPASASLVVRYVDVDTGTDVAAPSELTEIPDGTYSVHPAPVDLPESYTLTGDDEVTAVVANGVCTPAEIIFTYKNEPAEEATAEPTEEPIAETQEVVPQTAGLVVRYVDEATGEEIAEASELQDVPDGTYTVRPAPAELPEGYVLTGNEEATLVVTNGVAEPAEIIFTYQNEAAAEAEPEATGEPAAETEPEASEEPVAEPEAAAVIVRYVDDTTGEAVAEPSELNDIPDGTYTVRPAPVDLPEAYELVGESEQTLTVSGGVADPAEMVFTYHNTVAAEAEEEREAVEEPEAEPETETEPEAQTASVMVKYVDEDTGEEIAEASVLTDVPDGQYTVRPAPADLPEGFALTGDESAALTVSDGVADPAEIVFTYAQASEGTAEPTVVPTEESTAIQVRYVDVETGEDVADAVKLEGVADGEYIVRPAPANLKENYELTGDSEVKLVVEDGIASVSDIIFTYRYKDPDAEPDFAAISAVVKVHYCDVDGNPIAEDQMLELDTVGAQVLTPDADIVPKGYNAADVSAMVTVREDGSVSPEEVTFKLPLTDFEDGELINLFGTTTQKTVYVRTGPSKSNKKVTTVQKSGSYVWVNTQETNDSGEVWYKVVYEGKEGYIRGDLVKLMNQEATDAYMATLSTPVPHETEVPEVTATPEPTEEPTTEPTEEPTEEPTTEPTEEPTEEPTAEPTAEPETYTGYAVTVDTVALWDGVLTDSSRMIQTLDEDTLVTVSGQSYTEDGTWHLVTTLDNVTGFVEDEAITPISDEEAMDYVARWEEAGATPTPEPEAEPEATAEPVQVSGYFVTRGDGVCFRNMPSDRSVILAELERNTTVFVVGQVYDTEDGWPWHIVLMDGQWGYMRSDLIRMMTEEELAAYEQGNPTAEPTPAATPQPYDASSLSSYGYVYSSNSGRVNLRRNPSTKETTLAELRNYAFCLVLDTVDVNGTTWYYVDYDGTRGYVHGDYFVQMTLTELDSFLTDGRYEQGVTNNTAENATPSATFVTVEEQQATTWQDPNSGLNVAYATWVPIATVAPLDEAEATAEADETEEPEATEEPESTLLPEPVETEGVTEGSDQGGSSALIWVIVLVLVAAAGGGAYAYLLHKKNKERAAQRAAQRRAQAAKAQEVPKTNRTGSYGADGTRKQDPNAQKTDTQPAKTNNQQAAGAVKAASQRVAQRPYTPSSNATNNQYAPQRSTTLTGTQQTRQKPAETSSSRVTLNKTASPYAKSEAVKAEEARQAAAKTKATVKPEQKTTDAGTEAKQEDVRQNAAAEVPENRFTVRRRRTDNNNQNS